MQFARLCALAVISFICCDDAIDNSELAQGTAGVQAYVSAATGTYLEFT